MKDKIKITSIKIENYRQYFGIHNIEFPNREEGFSVIVGENGAGKSNLLNALNWCFYRKEPHTKKNNGYSIINKKYLESTKDGNIASMMVQVELQKGGDKFRISRVLKVIKNEYQYEDVDSITRILKITEVHGFPLPIGCEVLEPQSTFEILIKREHEQDFHLDKTTSVDVLMNEILPESLSSYFILDGEFLEKFWSGIEKVQIGVEQISQLHLLKRTSDHLDTFKKNVQPIGIEKIDNLTTKINQNDYFKNSQDDAGNKSFSAKPRYSFDISIGENEFYHATGKPRMKDLEEDIKKLDKDSEKIREKMNGSNNETVKILHEEKKITQDKYKELSKKEQQSEKEYFSSLIENMPLYFLKPPIEYVVRLVDDLREKGDLPYEAKKIFTNDLLERNTCICHTSLESKMIEGKEENIARIAVIKVRDSMAKDQGLDGCVSMRFYFEEKFLGNFDSFTDRCFDKPRISYSEIKSAAQKCNSKLKEINIKLQNLGLVDIEELVKNDIYISQLRREAIEEIKDIQYSLKDNAKNNKELESQRQKLLEKNDKSKRIAHDQKIWDILFNIFNKTYDELKNEIRHEVQEKTMEIFLSTMYKENLFKKFIIQNNFEVELIDNDNISILGSLSAGESLFLALSFISAIRNVTGFKFPLIIDTPLGRVSGTPRYLLSQALPKYLPDEQIIFLATDTEFLNPDTNVHAVKGRPELPFGQLLEEHIKIRYYLIKGMDKNAAKIVDFIPKWRAN